MAKADRAPDETTASPARRGPKRSPGAPVGPDEVRSAVLGAAAALFGERGVTAVSLRDIAVAANVEVALIGRYVGPRHEVIDEVYRTVSAQVAAELDAKPLSQLEFGRDANLGRWMTLLSYYNIRGLPTPADGPDPIATLAAILERYNGLDPETAKVRAAQITAISLGWRLFEAHLVRSTGLGDRALPGLRDDITAIQRLIGSTPWPTPPR